MIFVLSFNRRPSEQKLIERGCRWETASQSDEELHFFPILKEEELSPFFVGDRMIDMIYFEIKDGADIERLKHLRKKESEAWLALLTSPDISPVLYLKPGISPAMLLLRPFDDNTFSDSNRELFDAYFSEKSKNAENCFILKTREDLTRFPFEKISFFEARNKKIYLRVGSEEYDFYDSIENIAGQVPDYFIRCHRAYLVNGKRIKKVCMAENCIELHGGAVVPFSRTYRKNIKEFVK